MNWIYIFTNSTLLLLAFPSSVLSLIGFEFQILLLLVLMHPLPFLPVHPSGHRLSVGIDVINLLLKASIGFDVVCAAKLFANRNNDNGKVIGKLRFLKLLAIESWHPGSFRDFQ